MWYPGHFTSPKSGLGMRPCHTLHMSIEYVHVVMGHNSDLQVCIANAKLLHVEWNLHNPTTLIAETFLPCTVTEEWNVCFIMHIYSMLFIVETSEFHKANKTTSLT